MTSHDSPPPSPATKARTVPCPTCGGPSVFAATNPFRPFCSERCKNVDLGNWASESFRVPLATEPPDGEFGDPKQQPH